MNTKLSHEIKQSKPFASLEVEAYLNLQRTADCLLRKLSEFLKTYDLSPTQYNVLRILKGAGSSGLACREISDRLVTRDPDITRLLDRMEERGWVTRSRDSDDRRVVTARIAEKGLRLLAQVEQPGLEFNKQQLQHVGENGLRTLIDLLELARQGAS